MKRYAISLVFTKRLSGGNTNIHNSLRVITANSKEEAFGFAFDDVKENLKDHDFQFYSSVEIVDENNT